MIGGPAEGNLEELDLEVEKLDKQVTSQLVSRSTFIRDLDPRSLYIFSQTNYMRRVIVQIVDSR